MSADNLVLHDYVPRKWFVAFHQRHQRFACLVCSRRTGKTVACVNDMVAKALRSGKERPFFAFVAPFYAQAKAIAWAYLKQAVANFSEEVRESELSVKLPNGAIIRLFGADNPDSLRGLYFDGVVFDEMGDIPGTVFTSIVLPALLDREGWVVFIGTPKGRNSFYSLYQRSLHEATWFSLRLTCHDTTALSPAALQLARDEMDGDEFQQEFECSFDAAVRGSYYGKLLNQHADHVRPIAWDPAYLVQVAMDIGHTDDCAAWFWQEIAGERRYLEAFSIPGLDVADVVAILRGFPYQYAPIGLPHDAKAKSFQTGKSVMEQFHALDVRYQKVPSLSFQDGVQAVRKILPISYFNSESPGVMASYDHLKLYSREYDEKNEVFRASPKHDKHSHAADGFRYSAIMGRGAGSGEKGRVVTLRPGARRGAALNLESLYADRSQRVRSDRIS